MKGVIERDVEGHFLKDSEFIKFLNEEKSPHKILTYPEASFFNFWRKIYFDFRLMRLRSSIIANGKNFLEANKEASAKIKQINLDYVEL